MHTSYRSCLRVLIFCFGFAALSWPAGGCGDGTTDGNSAPEITSEAGNEAEENTEYSYEVVCTDPDGDALELDVGDEDTCGGVLEDNGDGTGTYTFTPDETLGGDACDMEVTCTDGGETAAQTTEVTVTEDNQAPDITNLPATRAVHRAGDGSFDAEASDADIPANELAWSIDSDTCSFAPEIDGSTGEVTWTCDGVETCTVDVAVTDNGAPPLGDSAELTIDCVGEGPFFESGAGTSATEHVEYVYDIVCMDTDDDALTLGIGDLDTCGGELTDNGDGTGTYAFTPDETDGGSACDLEVTCTDGGETATQTTEVTITEDNQAPVITNLPATRAVPWAGDGSFAAEAADADIPANALAWSINDTTCSFALEIDDSTGEVTWTCDGVETCTVDVEVTDDGAPPLGDSAELTIDCVGEGPFFESSAGTSATEHVEYVYDIVCTNTDDDALTLGLGDDDNCGGVLEDNGDGTGTYAFTPDETDGGSTCDVEVTCTDGDAAAAQKTTITIEEDNQAPDITNLPALRAVPWSDDGSFDAEASDADIPANELAWSINGTTCSFALEIDDSTGEVTWTCAGVETCTVDVAVIDNGAPPLGDSAVLTIDCVGEGPFFESGAGTAAMENTPYVYAMTCSDTDDDALTLGIGDLDTCEGELTDNGDGTGTYTFTPDETDGGSTCDVEVTCTDGDAAAAQKTTITIEEDNQAPNITNLPALRAVHWSDDGSFDAEASDADIPANALAWSIEGHTCTFALDIDDSSGLVTWTCAGVETCTADVAVTDNGAPPLGDSAVLTIDCVNTGPVFESGAGTAATENAAYVYAMTCTDADGDALTLGIGDLDTCGGELTDNGDGTGTYTFTPGEADGGSTCDLEVTCTDGDAAAAQKTTITIEEDNRAPVITNLPALRAVHWSDDGSFDAEASDADIPANALAWSIEGHTCTFALDIDDSSGLVTWTCAGVETCTADVAVTDNGAPPLGDTDVLTIDCVNTGPVFESGAGASAAENAAYVYAMTCTDVDGDALMLGIGDMDTCEGELTDNGDGTGTYTFTPGEADGGSTCDLEVTCTDGYAAAAQKTTITIEEDNQAPDITNLPAARAVHWGESGSFDAAASDDDVPANTLAWSIEGHTCTFTPLVGSSSGTVTWTCGGVESCSVDVTVRDNGTPPLSDTDTLSLACTNTAPEVAVDGPDTVIVGDEAVYTITCTDDDGDGLSISKGGGDTCGGTVVDLGAGQGAYTFTPDGSLDACTVEAACTDTQASATGSVPVAVLAANHVPYWTEPPFEVTVEAGAAFSRTNGRAADGDVPNSSPGDPGYIACSAFAGTCSFAIAVAGSGAGAADCSVSFTAGLSPETCSVGIRVLDGFGGAMDGTVFISVTLPPPRIIYVDDNAVGLENGTSWDDAFTTVQDAIDASSSGDWIWVAGGTYVAAGTDTVAAMKNGVYMYGGFDATESLLADRGRPSDNPSVLDGRDQSCQVVMGESNARLDGFTVMRGNATSECSNDDGAGMYNLNVSNTFVVNCLFEDNQAEDDGGGVYGLAAPITFSCCTFADNVAGGDGGGIFNRQSTGAISECIFTGNQADHGGGVYVYSSSPPITDCTFMNNSAGSGGGVYNRTLASPLISDCVFIDNRVTGGGGGLYNSNASDPMVTNCTFIGNYTAVNGGGIFNVGSDPSITNCTLSGNIAGSNGGGIYNFQSSPTVASCILWDDSAAVSGPEIFNNASTPTVSYSDIEGGYSGGTAIIDEDPVFVHAPLFMDRTTGAGTTATLEVADASLYDAGDVIEIENDGTGRTVSSAAGTTVTFAPALGAASEAGMLVEDWGPGADDLDGNYRIRPESPCKDTGTATGAPDHDLDGNARPSCEGYDMGAYETQCP